jgi:chromosome segregation ATPase
MFSLHLGQEDIGATPQDTTERQAFDLMASAYGPGYNGPLLTATELGPSAHPSQEYEDKYNQAKANQADLERKQKQLTAESDSLKSQQASLERQQSQLLAEKRQLQQEQSQLLARQAVLQRQAAQLQAQRVALQRQLAPLQRQVEQLQAQKRQLTQRREQIRRQAVALRAAIRANLRAQAALTARVGRDRARIRVLTRSVARFCGADPQSLACQRARRALAATQADLAAAQQALAAKKAQLQPLKRQVVALAREAAQVRRQAAALSRQAAQLARQAAPLLRQARALAVQGAALRRQANALAAQGAALRRQASALTAEGASLQRQASELQAQADALKRQQQQAEAEKKQTEQMKQELTDELTKAGGDDRGTDPRLVKLQDALATPTNVQLVSPPSINKSGDAVTFTVIPKTRPADPKTADLVTEMRTSVIPGATSEGGITAYVGGVTAANVDLASRISSKLAELILVVLALSIVLLLIAFRSLLIPVQAAVTNLLCVGAAFGVLVAPSNGAGGWTWSASRPRTAPCRSPAMCR